MAENILLMRSFENLRAAEACVKASEVHAKRMEKQPDALDPAQGMAPVVHG